MSCDEVTALLADRLKGLATPDEERRLEAHLAECRACRDGAAAMDALWADMGADEPVVPHERMRTRFHAALAVYEAGRTRGNPGGWLDRLLPLRLALQAGAAAALLLAGVLLGHELRAPNAEIAALRDDVRTLGLALLDHQSASERLLGIAWSRGADAAPQAVAALLNRVRYDSNDNVRLAAIDALRGWIDRPEVGAGLADALHVQRQPLLQVAIAAALLESGRPEAVAAVERLLDRDDLEPAVRAWLDAALRDAGDGGASSPTDV